MPIIRIQYFPILPNVAQRLQLTGRTAIQFVYFIVLIHSFDWGLSFRINLGRQVCLTSYGEDILSTAIALYNVLEHFLFDLSDWISTWCLGDSEMCRTKPILVILGCVLAITIRIWAVTISKPTTKIGIVTLILEYHFITTVHC